MSKLFEEMAAGLQEAIDFLQGKDVKVRVHIPHAIDTRRIRAKLDMSQEQFARAFGFSVDAVRHWEAGRRVPEAAAQSLLRVIDHDASMVQRALAEPVAARATRKAGVPKAERTKKLPATRKPPSRKAAVARAA